MGDALIQENEYLSNLIHAEQFVRHIYRGKLDACQTYIIGRLNYAQMSDMVKYSGALCVGMAEKNNPEMNQKWCTLPRNI
ncbi:hypothetical protein SAMN04488023_1681 [Pedobacter rhizosphaerae]|uniref:Uncharacterized protein n=1 Tax=Pedobacter rhizosphaerae TaxID=390241 RepID=A0A1H9WBV2_9SPHI|nr:hypothetical protein SAMN04488023_1681 [Pedobacter rhizosphaerae]